MQYKCNKVSSCKFVINILKTFNPPLFPLRNTPKFGFSQLGRYVVGARAPRIQRIRHDRRFRQLSARQILTSGLISIYREIPNDRLLARCVGENMERTFLWDEGVQFCTKCSYKQTGTHHKLRSLIREERRGVSFERPASSMRSLPFAFLFW